MLNKKYNQFEITIGGYVDVWIDNNENGQQGGFVDAWDLQKETFTIEKLNKKCLKEVKSRILEKLNRNTYKVVSARGFNKFVDIIDNRVLWSQYTNEDNTDEPSKSDWIKFRRGTKNLYVQDLNITVTINGEDVREDDLRAILNLN